MDPAELFAGFESLTLPLDEWNHRAHLTVAYTYLRTHPLEDAIDKMRAGIQAFNAHNGIPTGPDMGYHETVTQAWLRYMDGLMRAHGALDGADAFFERHGYLLHKFGLLTFYSRERIMSADARYGYVPPDLTDFPSPGAHVDLRS